MFSPANGFDTGKCLIFLHIPKAGGTTLHSIIERHYRPWEMYMVDGGNVVPSLERLKDLSTKRLSRLRVVKGHMPFGVHEFMPKDCMYITMLREPVERIISQYYYILREPVHYLYEEVTSRKMTLEDYVTSDLTSELDNGQTKLIRGFRNGDIGGAERTCGPEDLELAKENLRNHFLLCGLTESFDETLVLLSEYLDWSNINYARRNVTEARPQQKSIPNEVLTIIEERNKLDIELYDFVKTRFKDLLESQDESFYERVYDIQSFTPSIWYHVRERIRHKPYRYHRLLRYLLGRSGRHR